MHLLVIVFLGPFLEDILPLFEKADYVISKETEPNPYANWVKDTYFDVKKINLAYPDYKYPGFFFNAGQIFVTVGAIKEEKLNQFFDKDVYPYWKKNDLFPLVDQSVYNYLLPSLSSSGQLVLETASFMVWANTELVNQLSLDDIKNGAIKIGLIHWAGCYRDPSLSKMKGNDILKFFEKHYYSKIFIGNIKYILNVFWCQIIIDLKTNFKKLKGFLNDKKVN